MGGPFKNAIAGFNCTNSYLFKKLLNALFQENSSALILDIVGRCGLFDPHCTKDGRGKCKLQYHGEKVTLSASAYPKVSFSVFIRCGFSS